MKFIVSILLTALLAFACGLYLPWWSIAIASFVVAVLIHQRSWLSFLTGFFSLFFLWLFLILKINAANGNILAPRISMVMGFGSGTALLIFLSCLIGAIVGGLGALTGSLFRKITYRN